MTVLKLIMGGFQKIPNGGMLTWVDLTRLGLSKLRLRVFQISLFTWEITQITP